MKTAWATSCVPVIVLHCALLGAAELPVIEEVVVWGQDSRSGASSAHPGSVLTPGDFASINVATTEDLVKFEPGIAIRRRFIGDSNGTLGMRGSNMFQTSRSMVFADGVPLHYLLQTRWNGAPRWTMISASEIARVEVLYGPFSAEYSGNAMGGVVLIESAIPTQREIHFDSSAFTQRFDAYGFKDTLNGYKTFAAWGDKFGDTSLFVAWNHLENAAQPQTFYFAAPTSATELTAVSGALSANDERSLERQWFGDTGRVDNRTDNYKLKLGHSFGTWDALLNLAYEDRLTEARAPNSYLRDNTGASVWSGNVSQAGLALNIPAARLGVSELQRDSVSASLRVRGPLSDTIDLEMNLNRFEVLRDESRNSLANPADPAHTLAGEVYDFGATGWSSMEAKLQFTDFAGVADLQLRTGLRRELYQLNLDVFASDDYRSGSFARFTNRSGGRTALDAVFAQLDWQFDPRWTLGVGLRNEVFTSTQGYFSEAAAVIPGLELVAVPRVSNSASSPKFSLAWQAREQWQLAYALGKAYRFPIVEELFSQYSAYNSVSVANPELRPERGLHQNLMIERQLAAGALRVNLFQETIRDVIEAQSETLAGGLSVRTFIPIDEIDTRGAELIVNLDALFGSRLDMRFNLTYTDSTIVRNSADPTLEGNAYPRMPAWRSNLLATWHLSENWDAGLSLQYASDSFGRNDNTDRESGVYGAMDAFTMVGIKSTYRFANGISVGAGVDNLLDELAFVAHPWPGRTFYTNIAYDL